jgi:hypothetical protein
MPGARETFLGISFVCEFGTRFEKSFWPQHVEKRALCALGAWVVNFSLAARMEMMRELHPSNPGQRSECGSNLRKYFCLVSEEVS